MPIKRVVVLGGYGNFGKRIVAALAKLSDVTIFVCGRNRAKANKLCSALCGQNLPAKVLPAEVDINSALFVDQLRQLAPELVIHTSGPFQGQGYQVPEACIILKSHYIDLSDDRRFVCDIQSLHTQALENSVLLVSGASSVPGLSSVVVDHLQPLFETLEHIDFAIAPGNKAERGEATVRGILSYTGHPFSSFINGKWVNIYGWMSPRKLHFSDVVGRRWLANVDIPDLELFPNRYRGISTVRFQAGLELPFLHILMVAMAKVAKIGFVSDWSKWTKLILFLSNCLRGLGTDIGGMLVNLKGVDQNDKTLEVSWTLTAKNGIGPYIPTLSAIILAKKLIAGTLETRGAMPCLGLYSLEDFSQEAEGLGIYQEVNTNAG